MSEKFQPGEEMFDEVEEWRLTQAHYCIVLATTDASKSELWANVALGNTPVIEITSLGHDSNVFNEDGDPKGDMTADVCPGVKLWKRPGGSHLRARLGPAGGDAAPDARRHPEGEPGCRAGLHRGTDDQPAAGPAAP